MNGDESARSNRTLAMAVILGCGLLGVASACGTTDGSPPSASPDANSPAAPDAAGDTGTVGPMDATSPQDGATEGGDGGVDARYELRDGDGAPLDSTLSDAMNEADAGTEADAPDAIDAPVDLAHDAHEDTEASGDADASDTSTADSGLSATEALLLNMRDMDCLSCARQQGCLGTRCESLGSQVAAVGPEAGAPRSQLCLNTLSCLLQSQCYLDGVGVSVCICGLEVPAVCSASGPASGLDSDCVATEQAGLETTDAGLELDAESSVGLGAGVANAIILCLTNGFPCPTCL